MSQRIMAVAIAPHMAIDVVMIMNRWGKTCLFAPARTRARARAHTHTHTHTHTHQSLGYQCLFSNWMIRWPRSFGVTACVDHEDINITSDPDTVESAEVLAGVVGCLDGPSELHASVGDKILKVSQVVQCQIKIILWTSYRVRMRWEFVLSIQSFQRTKKERSLGGVKKKGKPEKERES